MSSNVQEKFDLEKDQGSVDHLEHIGDEKRVADTEQAAARVTDLDHGFEPAEVKHTLRKVDWRLIPVLAAMYTVSERAEKAWLTCRYQPWIVPTCRWLAPPTTWQ